MADSDKDKGKKTGDDDVDVDVDNDDDDNDDGNDKDNDDWTPPSKDEWRRVIKAKDRYKTEAQKRRERIQELERGKTNSGKSGDNDNGDLDKAIERARLEGENSALAKSHAKIAKQAAKAAFLAAGLKGKPDGLLKLIDVDELEFDDDGEVTGLEEQVNQLKSDYPELFSKSRNAGAGTGGRDKDGSDKPPAGRKTQSATERALARAFSARKDQS